MINCKARRLHILKGVGPSLSWMEPGNKTTNIYPGWRVTRAGGITLHHGLGTSNGSGCQKSWEGNGIFAEATSAGTFLIKCLRSAVIELHQIEAMKHRTAQSSIVTEWITLTTGYVSGPPRFLKEIYLHTLYLFPPLPSLRRASYKINYPDWIPLGRRLTMLLAQGCLTASVLLPPCAFVEFLEIFCMTDVLVFGQKNESTVSGSHGCLTSKEFIHPIGRFAWYRRPTRHRCLIQRKSGKG